MCKAGERIYRDLKFYILYYHHKFRKDVKLIIKVKKSEV